jgi:penicillin-binding protein 1C
VTRKALFRISGVTAMTPVAVGLVWFVIPPRDALVPRTDVGIEIRDRYGATLRSTRGSDGQRRQWISIDDVDPDLIAAFLAAEDRRFFEHHGIDWRAIMRAMRDNVRAGRIVSGASTITMQVVRLRHGMGRGWIGKIQQALWAMRVEWHYSKQEILESYLNQVPLGQATVGVEAASALYFGRSAAALSLGQAALLAALARMPTAHDPFVHAEAARQRRAGVLDALAASGRVTARDAERATLEPPTAPVSTGAFRAPHYTTRLLGTMQSTTTEQVIETPLDLELQTVVEDEVRRAVGDLVTHDARYAAVLVMENRTGHVLSWVGSPDFWDSVGGQVDMVVSPRQPGSALKPFLYGLALDRGYTPATVLDDVARTYLTNTGPYAPRNYDRRYHGPVRLRVALASSFNVPAVEVTSRLGVGDFLDLLHAAGFASLVESATHYGLGLTLGNGEVTLLELVNAYRALANDGVWRPANAFGLDASVAEAHHIMSAQSAALILDMLADPVARIPGFGVDSPFDFAFPVAVKTGTSHHFTDNWAVAVTGAFTVGVWVGNVNGHPMRNVSGVSGAGPLIHRVVLHVASRYPPGLLPNPALHDVVSVEVCALSGKSPGPYCPRVREWIPQSAPALEPCDWHQSIGVVLPDPYTEWLEVHERRRDWYVAATAPESRSELAASPKPFQIIAPLNGDSYRPQPGVDPRYATLGLRSSGGRAPIQWFVDGQAVSGSRWRLIPGDHVVTAHSAGGETDEVRITVR